MADACNPAPRLLHDFFDIAARRHPERIAVDVPPGWGRPHRARITYGELLARADALAGMLREHTHPDGVVGILLGRNSVWLYAAQLAVLKAGGAFACIDPVFPDAHMQAILDDGEVRVLLTDPDGKQRVDRSGLRIGHVIDVSGSSTARQAPQRPESHSASSPDHLAYVIYTSGTTGSPKGVMIEHRSVVNLVASDIDEFRLTPDDRVAQSSSPAYDSSIEETWLAFAAGATLVVMDEHTSRLGPDLVAWLRAERISVFCPPPTLLRTTQCDDPAAALPDLRLLYVGGEALTAELAERWGRGRRLVNGYGPTECTVTVVRGDVHPDRPITIGRPIRGHTAWVLDAALKPVAEGEAGELCLAGIGLARGYRNRAELTREKFPELPTMGRIYRTGDLVRRESNGELMYLGRIDAQVKLRGYRVELEAIEACIARCVGVREAACRLQGEGTGALLAASIVASNPDAPPNMAEIRDALRRELPHYMVPARFGLVDAIPRSVGGKIDRRALPDIGAEAGGSRREVVAPTNGLEAMISAAFASALKSQSPISTQDDFFLDLGGDSLSAVGVICSLRAHPEAATVTTRDLYEARTAAGLAARIAEHPVNQPLIRVGRPPEPGHAAHPFLVTAAQGAWLLLWLIVFSAAAYSIVFDLLPAMLDRFGFIGTLLLEVPLAILGMLAYALLAITTTVVLKLALIGEYRPIRTPVWSGYYLRHWLVQSAARAIPWNTLAGTVACAAVLRLLGARIGRRVHIHRGVNLQQGGWDLLVIGDDVTLNRDVHLGLVELDAQCLCVGPVTIGDMVTLDTRAAVSAHAVIEKGGLLTALSWLPEGQTMPPGERWDGVPAIPAGAAPPAPRVDAGRALHPITYSIVHLVSVVLIQSGATAAVLAILCLPVLAFGLTVGDLAAWMAAPSWSAGSVAIVAATATALVPVWLVFKALCVRALGRVDASTIDRWSLAYLRVWHKTGQVESAGLWLTGTLFWPMWLRLAGMKIGPNCEISTIIDVVPECVQIGSRSFLADGIYLGAPALHRGTATIGNTSLGRGTFLGNHVVIPAGAQLPEDLFVGVCTVADASLARAASSWFGHPPMELPTREVVHIDRRLTYDPGWVRWCNRLFWESLRFTLPVLPILVGSLWVWGASSIDAGWYALAFLVVPALSLAAIGLECLAVVALKWLLLGRARAGQHALWSCWCSRWDYLYVAWQFYALRPLTALEGTLYLPMYLRAMGVRIGRRVVLGPGMAQVADPDMIVIEDHATVSANYQAHSFEDRVLKLAPVTVRQGTTVGEAAVLFYGADVGENAWVSPNSVVMKNESLASGASFSGCPVQSHGEAVRNAAPASALDPNAGLEPIGAAEGRQAFLDIARGMALLGMIYMHFVPAEREGVSLSGVWMAVASTLEGKSAALFCVLAGIAWEIQAQRARQTPRTSLYFVRRSLALASAGVALHILAWPTEILVPLSVMMLVSLAVRSMGTGALIVATALVLALAPCVPGFLGDFVALDWKEDGSHLADRAVGWVTLRALAVDGNYPLVPWLAFPLIGILMARCFGSSSSRKMWLGSALLAFFVSQAYVWWADANPDALVGLEPYLTSAWVPTSLPFVLVTASAAIAAIAAVALWQGTRRSIPALSFLGLFGRASLTHYVLHICLVYVPLRAILSHEDWSVEIGVAAFLGYVAVAVPLTALWFRRFQRGPLEALWAMASGR